MKLNQLKTGQFARVLAIAALAIGATSANAAWDQGVTNVTNLAQLLVIALTGLCALAGVGAFAFAGKQLLKKAGDRGDDVEWSKIGYAVLAGVFLIAIAWVALQSVETLGGGQGNIGTSITIQR